MKRLYVDLAIPRRDRKPTKADGVVRYYCALMVMMFLLRNYV